MTKEKLEKAYHVWNRIEDLKEELEELGKAKEHSFRLGRQWFVMGEEDSKNFYAPLIAERKSELKRLKAEFKEM